MMIEALQKVGECFKKTFRIIENKSWPIALICDKGVTDSYLIKALLTYFFNESSECQTCITHN